MNYDRLSTFTIINKFIMSNPTPIFKKYHFFSIALGMVQYCFVFWAPLNIANAISNFFHFHFFRKDMGSILNTVYDEMASEVEGDDGRRRQWTSDLYFLLKCMIPSVPQFLNQQKKAANNPLPVTEGSNEHPMRS